MIRVYGASDDLVEIEGSVEEELNVINKPATVTITDAIGQGVRIIAEYARPILVPRGVWCIAVEPLDDDIPVPWPISIERAPGSAGAYSLAAVVLCPEAVTVEFHPKPGTGDDDV